METICVCGVSLEVVETFEYHVLAQDPITLITYLVEYQHLDTSVEVKYDIVDSNIFSLEGWKRWPANQRKLSKPQSKRRQSRPKVLALLAK